MPHFRIVLLLAAGLAAGVAWAGEAVTLDGAVIASGGTTSSSGGDITLDGTIAQPVAGPSGAGALQLDAGFWTPAAAPRAPSIYGELDLGDKGKLLLYGLPGQARFRFMFDVVREGLLGIVVLVDASTPQGAQGLADTLATYHEEIRTRPCILAINKNAEPPQALTDACQALLHRHGMVMPIASIDARKRDDIVYLFELLFLLLEHGADCMDTQAPAWA